MKKLYLLFFAILLVGQTRGQQFSPRYELVKMGPEVNTKSYHEMSPVISTDGKKLYFVENNHPQNTYGTDNSQDVWFSTLDDKGVWSQAKRLGPPINQNRYNTVFNVLPDGSLFVRGGRGKNEKGFSIVSPSGAWIELPIQDFAKMDKGRFNGATISADMKHVVMYFSEIAGSARSDLYISNQQPDGSWPRPVKMPMSTGSDEFGPFVGPDQNTLYFASDRIVPGHLGNVDIYKVTRLDDTWTKWSPPVNLGKGVNTVGGDAYFSLDEHGNVFTCRMGSLVDGGNYDIWILKPRDVKINVNVTVVNEKNQQPLPANVDINVKDQKPTTLKTNAAGKVETHLSEVAGFSVGTTVTGFLPKQVDISIPHLNNDTTIRVVLALTPILKKLVIKGTVFDKKTQQPVSAKVDVVSRPGNATTYSLSAEGGKYEQEVAGLGGYVFTASASGYLNSVDSVTLSNPDETPVTRDLYLTPIEVGTTVRLKNIYFDFDKTTLKPESFVELNKVVDFLKANPHVEIEIQGHTDNKGSDQYNENLSQGRSQAVVDYLVQQGIEQQRLSAHGFGESKPIDTNDTEDGRANNRRVEFTVLKK